MNPKRIPLDIIEIQRLIWKRRLAAGDGLVLPIARVSKSDQVGFSERYPGIVVTS